MQQPVELGLQLPFQFRAAYGQALLNLLNQSGRMLFKEQPLHLLRSQQIHLDAGVSGDFLKNGQGNCPGIRAMAG